MASGDPGAVQLGAVRDHILVGNAGTTPIWNLRAHEDEYTSYYVDAKVQSSPRASLLASVISSDIFTALTLSADATSLR